MLLVHNTIFEVWRRCSPKVVQPALAIPIIMQVRLRAAFDSTPALEGARRKLTELQPIAFGKPPQMHKAIIQRQLGKAAYRATGVIQAGVDTFQLALADVLQGRHAQLALEQAIE